MEVWEVYDVDTDVMQKLPITMSLATLRAHVWKGGADVMLYYKSNGRKAIKGEVDTTAAAATTNEEKGPSAVVSGSEVTPAGV